MQIIEKKLDEIKEYEKNPRKNDKAVDYVANSIKEFGFKVPIVIDKNNIIVAGHTRYKAAQQLKLDSVPCIIADDLTEQQVKAFRLADNKVSEQAKWDDELLSLELHDIDFEIDMFDFGFEANDFFTNTPAFKENERHRTDDAYNLGLIDHEDMSEFWQMPIIKNDNYIPSRLIGFNYAKTSKEKQTGIHFYLDDYQFERIWNKPEDYIEILKEYECILSPDFSLYMDMPMPMKIWNIYRSRLIGQYYQNQGIKVIPTLSWAEEATFKFCFEGIPEGSVVSISTIGVKANKEALNIWKAGVDEMIRRIKPSAIVVYGGKLDYEYGDINVVYFDNEVTSRMIKNKGKEV